LPLSLGTGAKSSHALAQRCLGRSLPRLANRSNFGRPGNASLSRSRHAGTHRTSKQILPGGSSWWRRVPQARSSPTWSPISGKRSLAPPAFLFQSTSWPIYGERPGESGALVLTSFAIRALLLPNFQRLAKSLPLVGHFLFAERKLTKSKFQALAKRRLQKHDFPGRQTSWTISATVPQPHFMTIYQMFYRSSDEIPVFYTGSFNCSDLFGGEEENGIRTGSRWIFARRKSA
jgi:hypothetical protein